jgi:hypothetical protein
VPIPDTVILGPQSKSASGEQGKEKPQNLPMEVTGEVHGVAVYKKSWPAAMARGIYDLRSTIYEKGTFRRARDERVGQGKDEARD